MEYLAAASQQQNQESWTAISPLYAAGSCDGGLAYGRFLDIAFFSFSFRSTTSTIEGREGNPRIIPTGFAHLPGKWDTVASVSLKFPIQWKVG